MLRRRHALLVSASLASAATLGAALASPLPFAPGDLVVATSTYAGDASTVTAGQALPGGGAAVANGAYPGVFANSTVDGSFGVTSPITLGEITPSGTSVGSFTLPASQIVTSFSSKSELALNRSTDGTAITLMGYQAPVNALDVSNSNTPGAVDPTNPVTAGPYNRAVAQVSANGGVHGTPSDAYSGNNGRAANLANGQYYMVGNAGNGSNPEPASVAAQAGVQLGAPGQTGTQQIGNFSVTQVTNPATDQPYPADKQPKDNNFRGETISGNTLYVSKGSGGNGIDTVYQVGAAGSLPTAANAASAPITILPGFPTTLASSSNVQYYPFGLFLANPTTLYVADEGPQGLSPSGTAGLEKWSLVNGAWQLGYTLQNGLNLDQPYAVAGYPAADDPATTGLRNLAGIVNPNGTVTLYAVTATYSGLADPGADPNALVSITDSLDATALPAGESFSTVVAPQYGAVVRGVTFAPEVGVGAGTPVPEPGSVALLGAGLTVLLATARKFMG